MKVLFYESRPEWGGAQKCELELILGLPQYEIDTIFVTSTEGPMVERLHGVGKKAHQIPIHAKIDSIRKDDIKNGILSKIQLSLHVFPHLMKLRKLIIELQPTIIYTSQFRSQLLIGWLGKLLGKKVIWHIHGEEKLNNILGKMAMNTAHQIIVVSENICKQYQSQFPNHRSKFRTIRNGVDIQKRKLENTADTVRLITVGSLLEAKRQDLLIAACQQVVRKGYFIHLDIVGEKPPWHSEQYKNSLSKLVDQNNLQPYVTFHGWVEQPQNLLSQADIFILPSDTEGLPLSIIEAMGVGLPCIATDVGGNSELIEHEKNGLLITKNSLDELVSSIIRLLEDKQLRMNMGKNSLALYEKYYTKDVFIKGVAGVLNTMEK